MVFLAVEKVVRKKVFGVCSNSLAEYRINYVDFHGVLGQTIRFKYCMQYLCLFGYTFLMQLYVATMIFVKNLG